MSESAVLTSFERQSIAVIEGAKRYGSVKNDNITTAGVRVVGESFNVWKDPQGMFYAKAVGKDKLIDEKKFKTEDEAIAYGKRMIELGNE
jgi:hypothetical protein